MKERTTDAKAYGIHFATIPSSERALIGYQLERLKKLGWTLPLAVDFIEKHGKAAPSLPLGTVADEFLATKESGGLRPRYVRTLRASIKRFLTGRRERLMADITPGEIQEYITSNGWLPATMRSYLIDVRTLFAFAVKRKYLRENTALAVDMPKAEEKPPGIVTPTQARAILNSSLDHAPDALPVIALSLFGGLRRSEAEALEWDEITDISIEVKAHKAKTRQRRLVPITPQLRAWLETARAAGGRLPAINYAENLKLILEKAGLRKEWPQNALRHSFASYFFAKHKNENETAYLMGNSPHMVFQHYREIVRPEDAEAFFEILPPADALQSAIAARKRSTRVPPPHEAKITPEILSEVFQGGKRALGRKEAVAALAARAKSSLGAAYLALAQDGRFKANLVEHEGKITWQGPSAETAKGLALW